MANLNKCLPDTTIKPLLLYPRQFSSADGVFYYLVASVPDFALIQVKLEVIPDFLKFFFRFI